MRLLSHGSCPMHGRMWKFTKDVFAYILFQNHSPLLFYTKEKIKTKHVNGKKSRLVYWDLNLCLGELDITSSSATHAMCFAMRVQHVRASRVVKDSHLGQEDERGGFKPAVELCICSSGTCGCSAALDITEQSENLVKPQCCCQQLWCGRGQVKGAKSAAKGLFQTCSPGAVGSGSLVAPLLSLAFGAGIDELCKLLWYAQCCHLPSVGSQAQWSPTLENSIF